jgi:hypothetical protein
MKKINLQNAIGEVFFIFLGITLAIAFQNWNENRKQNHLETEVLQQLKIALKNDLSDVNANINTHKRAQKGCRRLLEFLNAPDEINDTLMTKTIVQASDYTFLVSDVSTYEYLKSVGLHIIQNDSLRSQITNLYDVVYEGIYGIEGNANSIQIDLRKDIRKYYSANVNSLVPKPNLNQAKQDDEFKFDLKNLEFAHYLMIKRYQQKVKPELVKLIEMVEGELAER